MRRRTIATMTIAAGTCAAALSTAAWAGGGTQAVVDAGRSLVSVPAAAADELPRFDDCRQLRNWYVRQALPRSVRGASTGHRSSTHAGS